MHKLPTAGGIVTVFGNQEEARRCEDNASTANKNVHVIETPNEDNEAANSEELEKSGGISDGTHEEGAIVRRCARPNGDHRKRA